MSRNTPTPPPADPDETEDTTPPEDVDQAADETPSEAPAPHAASAGFGVTGKFSTTNRRDL